MFDLFTDRAMEVLREARNCAYRQTCGCINAEHILVGLFKTTNTIASDSLRLNGVKQEELEAALMFDDFVKHQDVLPFTNSAKKILEAAHQESKNLRHAYIGTEHILLGLLRKRVWDGEILKKLELDRVKLRAFILDRIGAKPE